MSEMLDCPSCGGPFPTGRRCCPHCHCRYPRFKRWKLLLAATFGLGAAACGDDTTAVVEYGPAMLTGDLSATPDLAPHDAAEKD
jgi:hypothetical protein